MKRPDDLPDFGKPPLDEVLLGIQFSPPANYQQIYAGQVWNLFKDRFPTVQEHPPLSPQFETFGQRGAVELNVGFAVGAQHDRFWFLSPDGDQLIQFQNDRLLHNWRKRSIPNNEYPRYESIVAQFEDEATKLERFFSDFGGVLAINQCEISYINHLVPAEAGGSLKPSAWLRFFRETVDDFCDFNLQIRRQINDISGSPAGRLTCVAGNATRRDGRPMIALNISARGAPQEPTLQSALEFIGKGREMIVKLFAEVTTDSAHVLWERKQ